MSIKRFMTISLSLCSAWLLLLLIVSPWGGLLTINFLVGSLAISASVYDWHTYRLPHLLTIGGAVFSLMGYGLLQGLDPLLGSLWGFATLKAAQVFCRWRHGRECLGSGDCLLMLSLGAMVGAEKLPVALIVAVVFAAFYIFQRRKMGKVVPFGPFLTMGALWVVF